MPDELQDKVYRELRALAGRAGASGREVELADLLTAYEDALSAGAHADPADLWALAGERPLGLW